MSDKKIAVYCKTQEEYDIVAKHYGRKDGYDFKNFPCIKSDQPDNGHASMGDTIDYKNVLFNEWILTEIPKVGDKVIITKSKENWATKMDKYNNTIQIVNSIHSENGSNLHFEGSYGYTWNFSQKHFRLATPEEITKYEKSNIPTSCPEYVECIDEDRSYTTHSEAKEYGCINYTKENCTNGVIYKVIATPLINDDTPGYVLEYDGKHYLIGQKGTTPSTKRSL